MEARTEPTEATTKDDIKKEPTFATTKEAIKKLYDHLDEDKMPQDSIGCACVVRIESDLSYVVLKKLLFNAANGSLANLQRLNQFFRDRESMLKGTKSFYHQYQGLLINKACMHVAKVLADCAIDPIYASYLTYEKRWQEDSKKEQEAIKNNNVSEEISSDDSKIYEYIFKFLFHAPDKPLEFGLRLIPEEHWKDFLEEMVRSYYLDSFLSFIHMLSQQVDRKNWPLCVGEIKKPYLVSMVMGFDIRRLGKELNGDVDKVVAELQDRTVKKFEDHALIRKYLFEVASSLKTEEEFRALMFCVYEVYDHARSKLPEYTSISGKTAKKLSSLINYAGTFFTSTPVSVSVSFSKDQKLDAERAVKDFLINADSMDNWMEYFKSQNLERHFGPLSDDTLGALSKVLTELGSRLASMKFRPMASK